MIRAVFDTNIWVSAIAFDGEVRRVLRSALGGRITVLTSPPLLAELEKTLGGRKFAYPPAMLSAILKEVESFSLLVHPRQPVNAIPADPADNRVLECAVEGRADLIVSGDNHLLSLKQFQGIAILSPAQFSKEHLKDT